MDCLIMRRLLRVVLVVLAALLLAGAGGAWWVRAQLLGSLPQLEGERQLFGLTAPVHVTRDALGIPTVRGATRIDVARAMGFLHAQDRFFQMDLARRRAAGELAALVGARALEVDREIRVHRFRAQAERTVTLLTAENRALLDAYTAGVNEGLERLDTAPFEYFLLRRDPAAWRAEDSFLVVLSMFITLQDADGSYEATLATMSDVLPEPMFDFLAPQGSEWDAPLVGGAFTLPAIPGPDVYDLRTRRTGKPPTRDIPPPLPDRAGLLPERSGAEAVGSNNFAVAGRLTLDGGALLANDMHLGIRVPNTWYRAALEWPDPGSPEPNRIIGVTLPGVPAVVAGSNTHQIGRASSRERIKLPALARTLK